MLTALPALPLKKILFQMSSLKTNHLKRDTIHLLTNDNNPQAKESKLVFESE